MKYGIKTPGLNNRNASKIIENQDGIKTHHFCHYNLTGKFQKTSPDISEVIDNLLK